MFLLHVFKASVSSLQRPEEGARCPGTGIPNSCKAAMCMLGMELGSSIRAASAFHY